MDTHGFFILLVEKHMERSGCFGSLKGANFCQLERGRKMLAIAKIPVGRQLHTMLLAENLRSI